jgi:alpha-beta hydrolase superfamily lysophospholipase
MTASRILEQTVSTEAGIELTFAGDSVGLSGQIDYPASPPPDNGFPLLFLLHHAGYDNRDWYWPFAQIGLGAGYAVFRWDKRGTGRSGAGGRGSVTQDAVNAYEIALEQAHINRKAVVILAQDAGSGLLGSAYGLFARVQKPQGVILVSNMLDQEAALAIEAPVRVLMSESDWNAWEQYAEAVCTAHQKMYNSEAHFYVVHGNVDRKLIEQDRLPASARTILTEWLRDLCLPSRSI